MLNETVEAVANEEQSTGGAARIWLVFLLFPVIGLVAAVVTVLADSAARNAASVAQTPAPTVIENDRAPEFELTGLNGETLRLADFAGRVVFVNFWATWCGPCRREMPAFAEFLAEQGDNGAVIIAVNNAESPEQIRRYFDDIGVDNIPVGLDPDLDVRRRYGVFNLPTTFIVGPDGSIEALKLGEITLEDLRAYTREAMG